MINIEATLLGWVLAWLVGTVIINTKISALTRGYGCSHGKQHSHADAETKQNNPSTLEDLLAVASVDFILHCF